MQVLAANRVVSSYENEPLSELWSRKQSLIATLLTYKSLLETVEKEIADRLQPLVEEAYQSAAKDSGTVHVRADGLDWEITTPKRVEWDHDKMESLCRAISEVGEDPFEFVKVSYSVPERVYDAMPNEIKSMAYDARTVKHGKPTIKIKEAK